MKKIACMALVVLLAMAGIGLGARMDGGRLGVPGTDLLRAAENSNTLYIHPGMTSAQIQAAIMAAGAGAATAPVTIRFGAGYYADLDLSLANDHVILDAGDPGVVLAGTIATSGSPTGVYIYTWDHPSGTYPASLTLTNITEL